MTTFSPLGVDRIRLIDLETAGSASHSVCEIGWQDVVCDGGGGSKLNKERGALCVNPGGPISTQTSHHRR